MLPDAPLSWSGGERNPGQCTRGGQSTHAYALAWAAPICSPAGMAGLDFQFFLVATRWHAGAD